MKNENYICYYVKKDKIESFENTTVTLYTNYNYGGSSYNYGIGKYDQTGHGCGNNPGNVLVGSSNQIGNDAINSLRIPSGLKVTLFRSNICSNDSTLTLFNDTSDLSRISYSRSNVQATWNHNTSAFIISRAPTNSVTLYSSAGFQQIAHSYTIGRYDINDGSYNKSADDLGGLSNQSLQSFQIHGGIQITLYQNGGFGGNSVTIASDTPNIKTNPIFVNNNVSSFIIALIPPRPSQPSNLEFSNVTNRGFTIQWNGGNNTATSYKYVINGTVVTPQTDNGLSNQNATFNNLTPGSNINIEIHALNGVNTDVSNSKSITIPGPINCLLSEWSALSACSASCDDTGIQTQTRTIITPDNWEGITCDSLGPLTKTFPCNGPVCPPPVDDSPIKIPGTAVTPNGYDAVGNALPVINADKNQIELEYPNTLDQTKDYCIPVLGTTITGPYINPNSNVIVKKVSNIPSRDRYHISRLITLSEPLNPNEDAKFNKKGEIYTFNFGNCLIDNMYATKSKTSTVIKTDDALAPTILVSSTIPPRNTLRTTAPALLYGSSIITEAPTEDSNMQIYLIAGIIAVVLIIGFIFFSGFFGKSKN